jgi:hypothetical protein
MSNKPQMSDKELIKEYKAYHDMIHITDCYGIGDLLRENQLIRELERRGYEIEIIEHVRVKKGDNYEE